MIPTTTIDRIKSETDVRELLAGILGPPDRQSGADHFWRCPFHDDNDPSFSATNEMYHCFGCQESGDAIQFIMDYYDKSFRDAIIQLNHGHAPDEQLTKEQSLQYAQQKAERYKIQLENAKRRYKTAIHELRSAEIDLVFHNNGHRELWHDRYGIIDSTIRYYRLGYCPDFEYQHRDETHTSETLTIPFYRPATQYQLTNLRHRLLQPNGAGKYRPHRAKLGQPLFFANLNRRDIPNVILVEGEIKAAVLWQYLLREFTEAEFPESSWLMHNTQIIGIPGLSVSQNNLPVFDEPETIWLFLDPDAYVPTGERGNWKPSKADMLAAKLGAEKCRMVQLPGKPDDLMVEGILKPRDMYHLMKNARRIETVV